MTVGAITIALLAISWAVLASLAVRAWESRARAAEARVDDARRRKSLAVSKGNRTRAANHKATIDETTGQLRLAIEAKRPTAPSEDLPA